MKRIAFFLLLCSIFLGCNNTQTPNYMIVYKNGGGQGDSYSETFLPNIKLELNPNKFTPSKEFYFKGWDKDNDKTPDFKDCQSVTFDDSQNPIELTAIWEKCIKVEFNAGSGTGTMEPQYFIPHTKQSLSENKFKQTKHYFAGWSKSKQIDEIDYSNKEEVSFEADTTLYATWLELK